MSEERKRAFSNGSEFDYWEHRNCDQCSKSRKNKGQMIDGSSPCELDDALTAAYVSDGTVSAEEYKRLGLPGNCTEKQET